jgi:hypothetical protein
MCSFNKLPNSQYLIGNKIRDEIWRDLSLLSADLDDVRFQFPIPLTEDLTHLRLAAHQHRVHVLLNPECLKIYYFKDLQLDFQ